MKNALRPMREGRRPVLALGLGLLILMMLCVPAGIAASFWSGAGDSPLQSAQAPGGLGYASFSKADLSGQFRGLACRGSCVSHQEGYAWAEEHAEHYNDCHAHNWAFAEGCLAYLRDNPPAT